MGGGGEERLETVQRGKREPAGRQQTPIITQLNIPL